MKRGTEKDLQKYLFWGVSIILIFLSYLVIKEFIIPLLSAFILAYLIRPVYNKLTPKINPTIAAIICIIIIVLIIIVPLGIIATNATIEAASFTKDINVKELFQTLKDIPVLANINIDFTELTNSIINVIAGSITSTLEKIPSLILGTVVTLLGIFYILIKWDVLAKELRKYIPFSKKDKIIKELKITTNNIIYGLILIASIEFAIALIGFYLLGIKFYILLSALIFFMAFFPGLGPTIIWVPVVIYFFFTGNYIHGAGAVLLGILLSSGIDIILRGKVMGDKAKINPLIMLIGIVGGIFVFGIFGFIIGPLILTYTLKLINELIKS